MANEVEGLDQILKKLGKLPEKIQKNVVKGAVRAAASSIAKEVKLNAPKSTGALKKSIKVVARRSKDKNIVSFSVVPRLNKKHGYLAHFFEYGTSKMRAQPFMRPAFESKGKDTVNVARKYMEKRVDKEIAKL